MCRYLTYSQTGHISLSRPALVQSIAFNPEPSPVARQLLSLPRPHHFSEEEIDDEHR